MSAALNILHLEDDPADAELIAAALRKERFEFKTTVCTHREVFGQLLGGGGFDVILADNHLPGFDGHAALAMAHEISPHTPFIFVSGFLGEETALESLKNGATDYVFKHNLARLGSAVRRAVQEAEDHRERLEAEHRLRESEATLRSFFETSPVLMGIIEPLPDDLLLVSFNHAVEQFLGVEQGVRPSRASDLGIPAEAIRAWRRAIAETDASGVPVRFEDSSHPSGEPRFLSATIAKLPTVPNRPTRYCFVAEDTTVRRQMEQQVLRSQRLESIGTLASGIAHDLNNVLAPVALALKLFRPKLTDPDDRDLITSVESSVSRGAKIIRQLLTFARGSEGDRKPIVWAKLVGELEQMIRDTFPRSIEAKVAVANGLGTVIGDSTQIYQVLMNLSVNARDAMPSGGLLVITVEDAELTPEQARLLPDPTRRRVVSIRVRDSGTGIPESTQARIFDPFFTTKEIGVGTGLGLSTALNIVKNHGGLITVDSALGRGTEFHICLPTQASGMMVPAAVPVRPVPAGSGEVILVVDDERSIRAVTRATLRDHGYVALAAADGQEALSIFKREAGRIRLVITDLMMPAMDGATLIDRIREIDPSMRFIAVSGLLEQTFSGQDGVRLLQKPFSAESLLHTIHEVLRSPSTGR